MGANRLLRVVGAGRRVTAAAWAAELEVPRLKNDAVSSNEKDGNRLHEPTSMAKFPKKATLVRWEMEWLSVGHAITDPAALLYRYTYRHVR
jgi:hypothetical protein